MEDAVRTSITLPLPPERAFVAFVDGFADWWPPEYTWSQQTLETIAIEPRAGGMCFEIGPHGFRLDWGRLLAWEPPTRLTFAWQIGPTRVPEPDPDRASEVDVEFNPYRSGTQIDLVHRGFERHGDGADGYRDAMGSPQGWEYILGRFAERCLPDSR